MSIQRTPTYNRYSYKNSLDEEHLRKEHIQNEERAFRSAEVQKDLASSLFKRPSSHITKIETDPYFKGLTLTRRIQKINVQFLDDKKSFYLKESWEGRYLEGCGMALHNLFFDEKFNFILTDKQNSGIIAMEEIPGKIILEVENKYVNQDMIRNYGKALEFAAMIGLVDRQSRNFIVNNQSGVINIDYGKIFQKLYRGAVDKCIIIPQELKKQSKYGQIEGRKILRELVEEKKENIEEIIEETAKLGGFDNTIYKHKIKRKFIQDTYNTFVNILERMN